MRCGKDLPCTLKDVSHNGTYVWVYRLFCVSAVRFQVTEDLGSLTVCMCLHMYPE